MCTLIVEAHQHPPEEKNRLQSLNCSSRGQHHHLVVFVVVYKNDDRLHQAGLFLLNEGPCRLVSQLSSRAAQQTGSQAALEFTRTQWNPWGAPRHSHAYTLRCVAYSMFHIGYLVEEKRLYLRVKGIVSKRLSISLRNARDVFILRPYTLLGSLL